jgi:hypothetical protein
MSMSPESVALESTDAMKMRVQPANWTFHFRPSVQLAFINGPDGKSVEIQTPRCCVPFGIRPPRDNDGKKLYLHIDVPHSTMIQQCEEIDEIVKNYVKEHTTDLFRSSRSPAFVEEAFGGTLKMPSNPIYNPTMRITISLMQGRTPEVWVCVKEPTSKDPMRARQGFLEDIEPFDEVITCVTPQFLWFRGNTCGVAYRATHIMVYKGTGRRPIASNLGFMDLDFELESQKQ